MPTDFDVSGPDDDDEAPENQVTVGFSDDIGHARQDLIQGAVTAISGFPGVSEAFQGDRELIVVTGDGLDPRDIEARLVAGWSTQA